VAAAAPRGRVAGLADLVTLTRFFFPEHGVLRPGPYAAIAAFGLACGLALASADLTQRLEWAFYDRLQRLASGGEPAPGVVVVAIDEPSFAEIGLQWPWPRSLHAALVDALVDAGARTIVFDVLFDAPSASDEADAALADAVRRAGNVVLAADYAIVEDRAYAIAQWVEPVPDLAAAAAATGAVRVPLDPDGVARRIAPVVDGRPALALAAARLQPGFEDPARLEGLQLFRFNGPPRRGIYTASYYQALDRERSLPDDVFRGKVVFVGRSLSAATEELSDHFASPVAVRMAGVEIHATAFDALMRGRIIADPLGTLAWSLVFVGVLSTVLAVPLYRSGPIASPALVLVVIAVLISLAGVLLVRAGVRLPAVAPAVSALALYGATASYRFILITHERRLIKRAFQSYVAPAIVEQMLSDPSKLQLGGQTYDVTIMFTDIEGFTTLSERLRPEPLRAHLSAYFQRMVDLLLAERATLDKFIGDAIMVYFGCPIVDPDHPFQACRAALAMQRGMVALNEEWAAQGLSPIRTRIGVNTGPVVAGNMGTDRIFNFTVLGDAVNLASRLEGANKAYGTLILVGEETHGRVQGAFEMRELDLLRVKGKAQPVAVYELAAEVGGLDAARRELFARFGDGLASYRRMQWTAAATAFERALAIDAADGPSRTFLARCHEYREQAPPPDWDGVHVMRTK
jgi:adenylate cyclase